MKGRATDGGVVGYVRRLRTVVRMGWGLIIIIEILGPVDSSVNSAWVGAWWEKNNKKHGLLAILHGVNIMR